MPTHRDTSAPPTGISSIRAARQPFLLLSALRLAHLATAFGRHGRWACAS
jgi:hypothetical protein